MKITELDDKTPHFLPGEKRELEHSVSDIDYICQMLAENCTEAIKAFRVVERPLYRGIKGWSGSEFKGASRNNRRPKDINPEIDSMINDILHNYGFTALRDNSIFCTSNRNDAASYGNQYYIFPIDGFKFTWSKKYDDFYVRVFDNPDYDEINAWIAAVEEDPEFLIKSSEFVDEKNSTFAEAVNSGHEIYIHGQYYAFHADSYVHKFDKFMGFYL